MKKRSVLSYLRLYFKMIAQDIKSRMAYRADFFVSTIALIMVNLGGFVTFWLIFKAIPNIRGFDFYEVLFIYSFSLIAAAPMQLLFDNLWQLWIHCEQGDFIKYCFKPINLFFYYTAETFDVKGIGTLVMGIGMFVYSWLKLGIDFSIAKLGMLILSIFGASLVLIGIMTFAASSAFITVYGCPILVFFNQFREYARYPITIFNKVFKFIFTFIFPLGFMAFYPVMFFLRPDSNYLLSFLSPVIGIIVFHIGYKAWMRGALKYAGTGS